MAAIHFDSQSVKKQAKLLEEAADQIQNQTVKVITAANEAVAASWSGKAAEIFVKFMQEQNTDLASGAASLREIAAVLRDACSSCLLYTSPSPRDGATSRMPSSA